MPFPIRKLKCECGLLTCRTCYARLRGRAKRAGQPLPSRAHALCQCGKCSKCKVRDYRRRRAAGEPMFVGRPAGRLAIAGRNRVFRFGGELSISYADLLADPGDNTFLKWAATRPAEWKRRTQEVLNRCEEQLCRENDEHT